MENTKRKFHKLFGRPPYYKWTKERIQEEIDKKLKEMEQPIIEVKEEVVLEHELPEVNPVHIDPIVLQLLKGQQDILTKLTESIDEIKNGISANREITPEEAKDIFNEELKTSHFRKNYTYQIYALTRMASDSSEEWNITGHEFGTEEEAIAYGDEHFKTAKGGKARYKIMKIGKPYLVRNEQA